MVFQNIAVFLVSTLSSLYIGAVLVRFLLALVRADFYNPLSQFLVKITNPVLIPLRRYIPAVGKIDTASLALAFGIQLVAAIILMILKGMNANPFSLIVLAVVELVRTSIWIFMVALIMQAVISWTGSAQGNPMSALLNNLTQPLLAPLKKVVPLVSGVDLSPLAAILGLQVLLILLSPFPALSS